MYHAAGYNRCLIDFIDKVFGFDDAQLRPQARKTVNLHFSPIPDQPAAEVTDRTSVPVLPPKDLCFIAPDLSQELRCFSKLIVRQQSIPLVRNLQRAS